MHIYIVTYFNSFLSPCFCGCGKGYRITQALKLLDEKLRISLIRKNCSGAVLVDLSKAFDKENHDELISKLHTYCFKKLFLKSIVILQK